MTVESVSLLLTRPSLNISWGFSIQGGLDYREPIVIQKVQLDSVAEKFGLRSGDHLLAIGSQPTFEMELDDAHDAMFRCGNKLPLTISRPEQILNNNYQQQVQSPRIQAVVHNQYNSPAGLYSSENIAESLLNHTRVLTNGNSINAVENTRILSNQTNQQTRKSTRSIPAVSYQNSYEEQRPDSRNSVASPLSPSGKKTPPPTPPKPQKQPSFPEQDAPPILTQSQRTAVRWPPAQESQQQPTRLQYEARSNQERRTEYETKVQQEQKVVSYDQRQFFQPQGRSQNFQRQQQNIQNQEFYQSPQPEETQHKQPISLQHQQQTISSQQQAVNPQHPSIKSQNYQQQPISVQQPIQQQPIEKRPPQQQNYGPEQQHKSTFNAPPLQDNRQKPQRQPSILVKQQSLPESDRDNSMQQQFYHADTRGAADDSGQNYQNEQNSWRGGQPQQTRTNVGWRPSDKRVTWAPENDAQERANRMVTWSPTLGRRTRAIWPPPESSPGIMTSSQGIHWGTESDKQAKKFIWPPPREDDHRPFRSQIAPRDPTRLGSQVWRPYSCENIQEQRSNFFRPKKAVRSPDQLFLNSSNATPLPPTYRAPPGTHYELPIESNE